MTTWVEQEVSLITTNDPNTGALNVNPGFSSWTFEVANGLTIPHNARNATLECPQAAVWYSSHLIKANGPNRLIVTVDDNVVPLQTFTIIFPPGLWSLEALNEEMNYQLIQLSGVTTFGDLFQIEGITATGKTRIVFSSVGFGRQITIDFTAANTIFELLGWNQGDTPQSYPVFPGPAPVWPQTRTSPNQATFDATGSYLFSTNLCGGIGIPVNSQQGNVLAQILIDVSAGSQVVFRPPVPTKVSVDHLIGKTINVASFQITNEKGEEVTFSGEVNTFILLLKWIVPIDDASLTGGNWQRD